MKGKFAPGLTGPKGCDTICNAWLCPEEKLEKTYSYLPSSRRQRGSKGILMGYQSGFFAGWDASAFFLVFMQLWAFWMSAIMVKHLSAVYKNVGQGASTLAVYYVGDLYLSYDPQNEKTNTTRLPCFLASIIIMLSIVLFATSDTDKRLEKNAQTPEELGDAQEAAGTRDVALKNPRNSINNGEEVEPVSIEFAVMSRSEVQKV